MCKCKCAKYWPHNWLCLKGIYWTFIVLFYIALVTFVYSLISLISVPAAIYEGAGQSKWIFMFNSLVPMFIGVLGCLTVAKVLQAVRKIKKAVAPCCCSAQAEEAAPEVTIESVVEHESK